MDNPLYDEAKKEQMECEARIGELEDKIKKIEVMSIELKSQFRCNGSDNYLDWIDAVLYDDIKSIRSIGTSFRKEYEFDIRKFNRIL